MPGPIRTALKVDLEKAAAEQPSLHVELIKDISLSDMLINATEPMASR